MTHYIDKAALMTEIERLHKAHSGKYGCDEVGLNLEYLEDFINTIEVKEVDLIVHTIIAECCDWLAMTTDLSHNEIESCRNMMLTVTEEQFKAQKGE